MGAAAYPFAPVRWMMKDAFHSDERIGAGVGAAFGAARRAGPHRADPVCRAAVCVAREPKRFVRFPSGGHVDLDDHGAIDVVKKFLAELP